VEKTLACILSRQQGIEEEKLPEMKIEKMIITEQEKKHWKRRNKKASAG
jgi:hypothetical protein